MPDRQSAASAYKWLPKFWFCVVWRRDRQLPCLLAQKGCRACPRSRPAMAMYLLLKTQTAKPEGVPVMVHVPFADRFEAGRLLADQLSFHKVPDDALVLALPRGGLPVGLAIAERLNLPLDVVVARKLGVPWQPEVAMGAIAGPVRV